MRAKSPASSKDFVGSRTATRTLPARTPNARAIHFLVAVNAELVEILRLTLTLLAHPVLGVGEDGKENQAEGNAGDRGLGLSKQIHQRGNEQHNGNCDQADGNFTPANVQVSGDFPLAVYRAR